MTLGRSDANFSNKQARETINEANRDTPAIECHDNGGGNMICRWTDDEGREHALYYNKETEFLRFNRENKQWIALLKNIEPSFSSTEKKLALDRASRDGANVPAQDGHFQPCEGYHEKLGCPKIKNIGGVDYWHYTWRGRILRMNPAEEKIAWSDADETYVVTYKKLT